MSTGKQHVQGIPAETGKAADSLPLQTPSEHDWMRSQKESTLLQSRLPVFAQAVSLHPQLRRHKQTAQHVDNACVP
jgi:hypothetical protein